MRRNWLPWAAMSELGGDPACWAHLVDDDEEPLAEGATFADLAAPPPDGSGAIWSLPHGGDLDANLVRLEPNGSVGEHVNDDVDVLMFVQSGSGHLSVDGVGRDLAGDRLALIPKGTARSVTAGPSGISYLSVHRRRSPMGIKRTDHS